MRRTLHFVAVTFPLSWGLVGLFALSGAKWGGPQSLVLGVLYMLMPAAASVLLLKYLYGEPVLESLGLKRNLNRWWVVAWLAPVGFSLAVLGASLLVPEVTLSWGLEGLLARFADTLPPEQLAKMQAQLATLPVHPVFLALGQALFAGPTINALAALGEELGWRGFLQRELAPLGFWKSSTLIGAIWGLWHAPLILQGHNYPQHPVVGVVLMTVFCLLLSPLFLFLRLKGGSVVAAAIAHGMLNATAGLPLMLLVGGSDLTVGVTGAAGLAVLAVLNVALALGWRRFAPAP